MKQTIEFPLDNGELILVEVEQSETGDAVKRVSRSDGSTFRAQQTLESALDKLHPVAEALIKKLKGLNEPADEVEVKFGIKMSLESGIVIASTALEANYEITLKWKRNGLSSVSHPG